MSTSAQLSNPLSSQKVAFFPAEEKKKERKKKRVLLFSPLEPEDLSFLF